MNKQTGTIITIVVAVLTLLCCTGPFCAGGIAIFAGLGTWNADLGGTSQSGSIPVAYGIAPCCLSILTLVIPVLAWLFLVRGKEDQPRADYIEGEITG